MNAVDTAGSWRELAQREGDGLEVVLKWHDSTDELIVSVTDEKTGVAFSLAAPPEKALDVFHHPYSYAASRPAPSTSLLVRT
jgi:hypothetical protein